MNKKEEKKIYKLTPELRELLEILFALDEARKVVAKPRGFFRKRINVKELIEISKSYAQAKTRFCIAATKKYPELNGKAARATLSGIEIIEDLKD